MRAVSSSTRRGCRVRKTRRPRRESGAVCPRALVRSRRAAGFGARHPSTRAERGAATAASARTRGTTRKVPREAYLSDVEGRTRPGLIEVDDLAATGRQQKASDQYAQQGAVPGARRGFIGKTVQVRSDGKLVRVYLGAELVKVHPAQTARRAVDGPERLSAEQAPHGAARRDLAGAARKRTGGAVGALCKQLPSGPRCEELRQAQGLAASVRALRSRAGQRAVRAGAGVRGARRAEKPERMFKAAQSVQDSDERRGQVIPLAVACPHPQSFATAWCQRRKTGRRRCSMSATSLNPELVTALKRLRHRGPCRRRRSVWRCARSRVCPIKTVLLMLLCDEISRRDSGATERRLSRPDLSPTRCPSRWDASANVDLRPTAATEICSPFNGLRRGPSKF